MTTRQPLMVLVSLLLLLLPGAACSNEPADSTAAPTTLEARVQSELDRLRAQHGLPGLTAAYVRADGAPAAFASGEADRELGLGATPATRMLSGSTGKTFVAALALALQAEGKLRLDDPLRTWLSEEPWFDRLPSREAITVRMLLNHSSGLADHVYSEAFGAELATLAPNRVLSPAELVGFILDLEPLFPAGEGYSYSDTNYILAGLVLERAGGAPYYEQIQRRFLYPLGLRLTAPSTGRIHPGLAQGYLAADGPLGGLDRTTLDGGVLRFDPVSEWTGGGLVTNPADLARWASALWGGKAIGPEALEEMLASVAPESGEGSRTGYGLGVYITQGAHGPEHGHGGWFPGYRTSFAFYPEHGLAVAVQTNTDAVEGEAVHAMRSALADLVLAESDASSGLR
jgi:D-alanyl-D-alanine carboxypeptidase